MNLRFPEQVIAILADSIQLGEDGFIVDALTLDIEERTLGEVVGE